MGKRMGAAFWCEHVAGWRRSGQSQRAYCARHGLNLNTLKGWSRKANKDVTEAGSGRALTLVPVSVAPEVGERGPDRLRVCSPGGWSLELSDRHLPWLIERLGVRP